MHFGKSILFLAVVAAVVCARNVPPKPRPMPCFGCPLPIDNLEDPNLQEVANFAARELGAEANKAVEIVEIISAEQQVVAGLNYFIRALVSVSDVDNQSNPATTTCEFRVFMNLRGQYSLKKHECDNKSLFD